MATYGNFKVIEIDHYMMEIYKKKKKKKKKKKWWKYQFYS